MGESPELSQPENTSESQPIKKKRRWWLAIAILIALAGIAGAAVWTYYSLLPRLGSKALDYLTFQTYVPDETLADEPFDMVLTITNFGSAPIPLKGIWLSQGMAAGDQIISVTPDEPQNLVIEEGGTLIPLAIDLAAGSTSRVAVRVIAGAPRLHAGSIKLVGSFFALTRAETYNVVDKLSAQEPQSTPEKPPLALPPIPIANPKLPLEAIVKISSYVPHDNRAALVQLGSGVLVGANGTILTSATLVSSEPGMDLVLFGVYVPTGNLSELYTHYHAEIFDIDKDNDTAILRIITDENNELIEPATMNFPYVPLGDSSTLAANDKLVVAGYPHQEYVPSIKYAQVGDVGADGAGKTIRFSEKIEGGFSGGAVLNEKGEVIGIASPANYRGDDQYTDCLQIYDSNRDGQIDALDRCYPTMGKLDVIQPVNPVKELVRKGIDFKLQKLLELTDEYKDAPDGTVMYQNDFQAGLDRLFPMNDSQISLVDGSLILASNSAMTGVVATTDKMRNSSVSVEVRPYESAKGNGIFGVFCRMSDEGDHYGMLVSETGLFSILYAMGNKQVAPLLDWTRSPDIPQHKPFTLTGSCYENLVTLSVNGKELGRVEVDGIYSGASGISVAHPDKLWFWGAFDNFTIRKLDLADLSPSG